MLKNSVNRLIHSHLKFTLRYASSSSTAASLVKNSDKYQELSKL